jgi:hypothetical protein
MPEGLSVTKTSAIFLLSRIINPLSNYEPWSFRNLFSMCCNRASLCGNSCQVSQLCRCQAERVCVGAIFSAQMAGGHQPHWPSTTAHHHSMSGWPLRACVATWRCHMPAQTPPSLSQMALEKLPQVALCLFVGTMPWAC